MQEYLNDLSGVQREAVTNTQGPSLVIASAGSGKTRVLTYRIAHLLTLGVKPWNILALTFTNKAAREMKERIARIVGSETASKLWMGTFHSIFARILRKEAELLGYSSTFTIYDTTDSRNLISQIVKELNLDKQVYKPSDIHSRISMAKNNLVTPVAYASNSAIVTQDVKARKGEVGKIYSLYAQRCYKSSVMDFDDLLLNTNVLFRDFPDVLERYQKKFQYILVDEYQDTNYAQYLIVRKLAELHRNVCVVGDDAQSIYSFRGAKIENILNFRNDYKDYKLFKLEQNYRSTQTIVNAANSVIAKNTKQLQKEAFSAGDVGDKIKLIKAYTDQEEGFLVAAEIASVVQQSHCNYSDIAILYRTNAQSRIFEETLRKRNIPYRIYGGMSFYQRKEIKDLLAYFRLAVNPSDDEALNRIVNYPARGIGKTTMEYLSEFAESKGVNLWAAIENLGSEPTPIKGPAERKLKDFIKTVSNFRALVFNTDAYEAAYSIAKDAGILNDLKTDTSPEGISRMQNVEELINSIKEFIENQKSEGVEETVTLVDYLENVALLTDMDANDKDDTNRVNVMTVHSSKGLEFDYVFLTGMEDNLFPSSMTNYSLDDLEEERRLFYVAITRAARRVTLSFAQTRYKWGTPTNANPSRFIKEIDPRFIDGSGLSDSNSYADADPRRTMQMQYGTKQHQSGTSKVQQHMGRVQPSSAQNTNVKTENIVPDSISEGMLVYHNKFGVGKVVNLEGDDANKKAVVLFDAVGQKNLLLKFANLKRVVD